MRVYEDTVSALLYTLLGARTGERDSISYRRTNDVVAQVLAWRRQMPAHLGAAVIVATVGLALLPLPTCGRTLAGLNAERRAARVAAFRRSRIGPLRDIVRFWETLAVFEWLSAAAGSRDPGV